MSCTHWLIVLALAPLVPAQEPENARLRGLREAVSRISNPEHRFQFLLSRARDTRSPLANAAEELLAREVGAAKRLRKAAERSSPRARGAALAALVRRPRIDLAFALRRAIDDRSAAVLRRVLKALRQVGKLGTAREILQQDLLDNVAAIRMRAARGLAELGDPRAIPHLAAAARIKPCKCGTRRRRRAHVAVVTQTAVLARFSAEVA